MSKSTNLLLVKLESNLSDVLLMYRVWTNLKNIPHDVFLQSRIMDPDRTATYFLAIQNQVIMLSSNLQLIFNSDYMVEVNEYTYRFDFALF